MMIAIMMPITRIERMAAVITVNTVNASDFIYFILHLYIARSMSGTSRNKRPASMARSQTINASNGI